jgi:small subunit ribosomal protein S11
MYKNRYNLKSKKKFDAEKLSLPNEGCLYISFRQRNVFFTITDNDGSPLYTSSIGALGYKNTNKKTPLAAEETAKYVLGLIRSRGMNRIRLILKGYTFHRSYVMRQILESKLGFVSIQDKTYMPFGGCRPKAYRS